MKTFCYKTDDGKVHEIDVGSYDEMMAREVEKGVVVLDDGRRATRDLCSEQTTRSGGKGWPMLVTMDMPIGDGKAFNEKLRAKGVTPVDVVPHKGYEVTSPEHYRAVLRAHDRFNKDDVRSPRHARG